MDFEVKFVGDRFQQSVPQAYYHELLTATSSAIIEKNIPGRELRWIVYEKNSKRLWDSFVLDLQLLIQNHVMNG